MPKEWRGATPGNDAPALDFAGALPGMRRPLPGADSVPAKHPVNARESLEEPAKLSVAPPEPEILSSAGPAAGESESADIRRDLRAAAGEPKLTVPLSDPWQELKSALTGTEQEALRLLLRGGADQGGTNPSGAGQPGPAQSGGAQPGTGQPGPDRPDPAQSAQALKKFADSQGIMLEILMDGINEKAMDAIGDSLLDSDFAIYEDYIEQVKEMVEET